MLISIALATYNGEKYLREQLDSILSQSYSNWELIIGDDCSSDKTLDILSEYSSKDSRITIYKNKENLGFKKNFESIFSRCHGDYIACCDQDDVWTKDHLEILLQNIGENDCIGANALICDSNLNSTNKTTLDFFKIKKSPFDNQELFKHECYYNLIQGTTSLFKRSLLCKLAKIPDDAMYHDHWIALNASINNGCCYIPDTILHYRNHQKNVIGTKGSTFKSVFHSILKTKSLRKEIYRSRIALLEELSSTVTYQAQQQTITEALTFLKNLQSNSKRVRSTVFFIKNYQSITLSTYKQYKTFLYRIFALAILGMLL